MTAEPHRGARTVAVVISESETFAVIEYCDGLYRVDADGDWLLDEARHLLARRLEQQHAGG